MRPTPGSGSRVDDLSTGPPRSIAQPDPDARLGPEVLDPLGALAQLRDQVAAVQPTYEISICGGSPELRRTVVR